MRTGFYHPERGYWETDGNPSEKYRAKYPAGTVEIPPKPAADHEWIDGAWVYVDPPAVELPPDPIIEAMEAFAAELPADAQARLKPHLDAVKQARGRDV